LHGEQLSKKRNRLLGALRSLTIIQLNIGLKNSMTIAENTEVDSYKDIPEKYKFDSGVVRLRLLAGLIGSDGYYDALSQYVLILSRKRLTHYSMTWYLFVEV
jgi:hypothetical protein